MPLDPSIILGAKSPQFDLSQFSPMNAMATAAKFKQAKQEGELNALKMAEYERTRTEEQDFRDYLATTEKPNDPANRANFLRYGKTGAAYGEALDKQETAALTQKKSKFDIQDARKKFVAQAQRDTSQNPSDANITAFKEDLLANPLFNDDEKKQMAAGADRILAMPVGERKAFMSSQGASASELKPTLTSQTLGGTTRLISTPAFGGTATPVAGSEGAVTATPAQLETNKIAQARLTFDKNKFAWEQSNPGYELKEGEDGTVMAINKRTLQAVPVTVGGAAPAASGVPAAVPAAAGAGMPSARMPAAQAPLAGATPTAAQPLRGKGKEAPVKFNDTDLQLSGLAGSLKDFRKEVAKDVFTGAKFLPTGADTARMQAKYTALLMGVKDLYTLGALTGPDMGIIESQLTNPASWSGKLTSKEGFEEQIKVIENMLKRSATNLENTYSRVPKATKKALQDLSSDASGAGVDTSNPLLRR
jgi:hypothetical protein